ncbi:MAG TPA: phage major capsid protein [Sedimentisphaerales bacterium]|nr:phage major capsid protein [Sedimentisphaerales bacterium]
MPLIEERIAAGFEAAGERMNTFEQNQKELQESVNILTKMLREYGRALSAGNPPFDQESNRFWRTEEDARQFGELVLTAIGRKAMAEGTNIGGGALVDATLSAQVIQRLGKYGKLRGNCTVVPIGSAAQHFPRVQSDLTVYCPGEGGTISESDMGFNVVKMIPKTFVALAAISNELDDDSIVGLGEIIGMSMARSMAKKEDEIGFVGDGTATFFGMTGICQALLNVDATIASIKGLVVGAGDTYAELTLGDFRKVVGILPEDCDDTAKWYMHKRFYYSVVYPLAETAGVANIFEILTDRKGRFLLGYPVEFVHCMPYTGAASQICALLGDLQMGCYIADRKMLTIEQSSEVKFLTNQKAIRGVERIDINAFGVGDTSEPGPIVGLITAAA